jgi:serine/threonine protein kinase
MYLFLWVHNIVLQVHRDLKSDNVLLDEHWVAKVADFGSSRKLRNNRPTEIVSAFTGTRQVARTSDATMIAELSNPNGVAGPMKLGALDSRGTMSKAVGTLLWMAPEMFRGDQNYDSAVDVYSYGMILWELATRQIPWPNVRSDDLPREMFVEALNRELQTGRRPLIPLAIAEANPDFVEMIHRCWAGDPEDRPTFSVVVDAMAACLRRRACYC